MRLRRLKQPLEVFCPSISFTTILCSSFKPLSLAFRMFPSECRCLSLPFPILALCYCPQQMEWVRQRGCELIDCSHLRALFLDSKRHAFQIESCQSQVVRRPMRDNSDLPARSVTSFQQICGHCHGLFHAVIWTSWFCTAANPTMVGHTGPQKTKMWGYWAAQATPPPLILSLVPFISRSRQDHRVLSPPSDVRTRVRHRTTDSQIQTHTERHTQRHTHRETHTHRDTRQNHTHTRQNHTHTKTTHTHAKTTHTRQNHTHTKTTHTHAKRKTCHALRRVQN